jgi:archaellum biogenesis protein FlaJ (TadC family)
VDDEDRRDDARHRWDAEQRTLDREVDELTAELRTVIPGVTVLLAFLLTVPFAAGFPELGTVQQAAYFTAFLSTALAVVFLVGESAYHRLRGKPYDKGLLLRTATRQAVAALVLLAVALGAVVFLVTDVLYGSWVSVPLAAALLALAAVAWFGIPLRRRLRGDR